MTNGEAKGMSAGIRDAENLAVLKKLGVHPENISFLGGRHGIGDKMLVHSLDRSLALLEKHLGSTPIDQIFCLAWEGGHPDHDASHLVALALARARRLLGRVWQFPLYNGKGTPGELFRVMAPLERGAGCRERWIALREGARVAPLSLAYRSQRLSWQPSTSAADRASARSVAVTLHVGSRVEMPSVKTYCFGSRLSSCPMFLRSSEPAREEPV